MVFSHYLSHLPHLNWYSLMRGVCCQQELEFIAPSSDRTLDLYLYSAWLNPFNLARSICRVNHIAKLWAEKIAPLQITDMHLINLFLLLSFFFFFSFFLKAWVELKSFSFVMESLYFVVLFYKSLFGIKNKTRLWRFKVKVKLGWQYKNKKWWKKSFEELLNQSIQES